MDDLTEKLTSLLQDPKGMEQIKNIAQSFLQQNTPAQPAPAPSAPASAGGGGLDISPDMLQTVAKLSSAFKTQNTEDDNIRFLLARKPLLSEERRARTDTAMKLMKMMKLLPALTESGIFSMF